MSAAAAIPTITDDDADEYECAGDDGQCGNRADLSGFDPAYADGRLIDMDSSAPDAWAGWDCVYRCRDCGALVRIEVERSTT